MAQTSSYGTILAPIPLLSPPNSNIGTIDYQGPPQYSSAIPPWVISPDLFIADAYTDASAVAVGSVVMPYTGDEFVEPSYWYDNTTPHAGQIFADYGHIIDTALLTEEQRKESSTHST